MPDGRQYPFGQRPMVMWTTTGTVAHVRMSGTATGLCGEFVDTAPQGETGMDTLVPVQITCLGCEREVAKLVIESPEKATDDGH